MSELTSLVIRSKHAPNGTKPHIWDIVPQPSELIDNIKTGAVSDKESDISKLGTVISGMPSIFARANMFPIAFQKAKIPNPDNKGLIKFYESLISEWRGLIACLALNSEK